MVGGCGRRLTTAAKLQEGSRLICTRGAVSPSPVANCGLPQPKGTSLSETSERPSEPHKPSNVLDTRTLLTVRLTEHHSGLTLTLIGRTRAGTYYEADVWSWTNKQIPEPTLLDVINSLGAHLTTALINSCGVQEVLEGMPSVP